MSTNNDTITPNIDNKRNENDGNSNNDNIYNKLKNFIISVLSIIVIVVIYFLLSSYVLYSCKVAQSNIMPTEINCFPYEDLKPEIQEIMTNIFLTDSEPQLSEKLKFPYDNHNSKNLLIEMLKKYKNAPRASNITNYLISIINNFLCFNYEGLNGFFNFINNMPEILIILFGPIISTIYISFLFIVDHFYLIYLWFSNMSWLFKKNTNNSATASKPRWSYVSYFNTIEFTTSIILFILFLFLFWVFIPGIPLVVFILLGWCLFSITSYKSILNNTNSSLLKIQKEVFKHFKITISTILSILIIISAFSNLGNIPGAFCLIVVLLIYFGFVSIDIFKEKEETNLSKLTSFDQANKKCKYLSNYIYTQLLNKIPFFSGGGEKILLSEIKKISKKIENNN